MGGSALADRPASLFVSTFNMGPIKVRVKRTDSDRWIDCTARRTALIRILDPRNPQDLRGLGGQLGEWVPLGYDVYAIGLQECNCVDELRCVRACVIKLQSPFP